MHEAVDIFEGAIPSTDPTEVYAVTHRALASAIKVIARDHDIDVIIRTHARDRRVAAWLEDTAEALEEIGEVDPAVDWAKQATDHDHGHQSLKAADYWCRTRSWPRLRRAPVTRCSSHSSP